MAVAAPTTPFVWGAGGSIKTPEQVAREREIAAALMMEGSDYSPVGHWLAGAARASQAGLGALKDWRANEAENAGREGFQSRWDSVFGGGAAPVAADPVAAALVAPETAVDAVNAVGAVPSGTSADYIRQGLVGRGLPEHVADAFILNMQDESGLNPGINEAQPLVPGSRGGYGLYQLTGPRRVAYEQFAQQRGVSPDDVDAQLDFLMMELQGPEAKAAQAILSAPDTGTAAAAIVNQFLRPAEEHRARRAAAYMGGAAAPQTTRVAQASTPDIASLLGLASDPWANDTQRSIIDALVGQQLQQQDPAYQLDLALKQAQLDAALNPVVEPQALINTGDGRIFDPNKGEWIVAPNSGLPEAPDLVELFDDATGLPYKARWNAETGQYERVGGVKAPSGTQIAVDPTTGAITFQQGVGLKPLTEQQSKDTVYATRAAGALPLIDQYGTALTNPVEHAMGIDPTGIVRGNQTPEFQQAHQAGQEFLQAILRKDTGAAITAQETEQYGKVYLPQPGDTPELLEQKRISRQRALAAIEAGMPPQAILQQEQALRQTGAAPTAAPVPAGQSQAPRVTTQEEYDALPSGSPYMAPDGTIRTKR